MFQDNFVGSQHTSPPKHGQVQAALSLLAAYGAAPPKLRQDQLPKAVPQTCQVESSEGSRVGEGAESFHKW